jgi:type I restriction enzyme R subunit
MPNLNPEQFARQRIDTQLAASGWVVQDRNAIDFNAGPGIAVREYPTDTGPADYVLFVDKQAVGVIEAKKEEVGQNITVVENQTAEYANARLKWIKNQRSIPFLYESTGAITRFTDARDPKDLAEDIVENIEAGLNNFRTVLAAFGK